ncbi:MAG: SAM-dependent methyltransferase [Candidatus Methanohalarchaeum thermophilum]|uniref:SAM-dependent methyltransferase n=1 Tax=Methanohalarchaeum thermophilum TaxID=1903181 RepID=A0A1Q6DUL5_METT1|nr:MAG: SAM-dependent methyltransferase [Candidatus Methanohalarchaeum thermophilum]
MKEGTDIFGEILCDYRDGRDVFEIIERSDGFVAFNSIDRYFACYDDWPKIEKRAMEYVEGRVLDLGCGAGRHSIFLQSEGFDLLAIDISPTAIRVCEERGVERTKVMDFREVGELNEEFGTVLLLGNNFGFLGKKVTSRKVLNDLYEITSENGKILAESKKPSKLNGFSSARKRNKDIMTYEVRVKYREKSTDWFKFLSVSEEGMKEILEGTGWRIDSVLKSEDLNVFVVKK